MLAGELIPQANVHPGEFTAGNSPQVNPSPRPDSLCSQTSPKPYVEKLFQGLIATTAATTRQWNESAPQPRQRGLLSCHAEACQSCTMTTSGERGEAGEERSPTFQTSIWAAQVDSTAGTGRKWNFANQPLIWITAINHTHCHIWSKPGEDSEAQISQFVRGRNGYSCTILFFQYYASHILY
jgi:hypothetical protein